MGSTCKVFGGAASLLQLRVVDPCFEVIAVPSVIQIVHRPGPDTAKTRPECKICCFDDIQLACLQLANSV